MSRKGASLSLSGLPPRCRLPGFPRDPCHGFVNGQGTRERLQAAGPHTQVWRGPQAGGGHREAWRVFQARELNKTHSALKKQPQRSR